MIDEKYLDYWDSIYKKQNYFGTGPTKLAIMAESILKTRNVKQILEIGCGQGRDALFFAHLGYEVDAFDISSNAVDSVNKTKDLLGLNNLKINVHDIKKSLDYNEQYFDFVFSNLALQFFNIDELDEIFSNIARIMKKDSQFLFSTKKEGDKYHKFGHQISEHAFESNNITRYFYPKQMLTTIIEKNFNKIIQFDSEKHINLDSTVSVWWKILVQK